MAFPSDLEIAKQADLRSLTDLAADAGIPTEHLAPYGTGAAKIELDAIAAMAARPQDKYVVVSAITPPVALAAYAGAAARARRS